MIVSNIKFKKIEPIKGHVGFISCVIDNWLFLNNIAIFTRFDEPEKIRLVFPEKRVGEQRISIFHPIKNSAYFTFEQAVFKELKELI